MKPKHDSAYELARQIKSSSSMNDIWRCTKISLRTAWRLVKILCVTLLAVAMGLILLMGVASAMLGSNERAGRSRGNGGTGSQFFDFVNSVTWLPRQLWGGMVLLLQVLLLLIIFAAQWIGAVFRSHQSVCASLIGIGLAGLAAWAFRVEWKVEFAASVYDRPGPMSWIMGIVTIAFFVWSWWTQTLPGFFRNLFYNGAMPQ